MRATILLLTCLWSSWGWSEYRAYQLLITNAQTGQEKRILSTFDNIQYRGFYALSPGDNIQIENSWMCWENTSYHKPICPPPEVVPPTGQRTNSRKVVQSR